MIVLGIDPGIGRVGWGLVEHGDRDKDVFYVACGCIKTPKDLPHAERISVILK